MSSVCGWCFYYNCCGRCPAPDLFEILGTSEMTIASSVVAISPSRHKWKKRQEPVSGVVSHEELWGRERELWPGVHRDHSMTWEGLARKHSILVHPLTQGFSSLHCARKLSDESWEMRQPGRVWPRPRECGRWLTRAGWFCVGRSGQWAGGRREKAKGRGKADYEGPLLTCSESRGAGGPSGDSLGGVSCAKNQ